MEKLRIPNVVAGKMGVDCTQAGVLFLCNILDHNNVWRTPNRLCFGQELAAAKSCRSLPSIRRKPFLTGCLSRYRAVVVATTACHGDRHKRMRASRDRQL